MNETCTHLDTIRDVTPSALGCEECLKTGSIWVHLPDLPDLRPCRLLRFLAQQACDQAFSPVEASDRRGL